MTRKKTKGAQPEFGAAPLLDFGRTRLEIRYEHERFPDGSFRTATQQLSPRLEPSLVVTGQHPLSVRCNEFPNSTKKT